MTSKDRPDESGRVKSDRRKIWSWALYDWADSAFATTVMAGFFPLFFKNYWSDPGDPLQSTFCLGLANSGASFLVAIMAPFLGSVADKGNAKKRFLALFTVVGCAMTAGLWLAGQGQWRLAVFLYVMANVGFMGSNIFYDSLLPSVSDDSERDRTSALGYALGYVGGGLLFALNVAMLLKPGVFGLAGKASAVKLSFVSVAVWWAAFSVPLFRYVKEPAYQRSVPLGRALTLGWAELMSTMREIRSYRVVWVFLLAYWLYIDGVDTIVKMAVDYGMTLGFPDDSLIIALLIVQFVAFPAALAYGRLAGVIGAKRAIFSGIAAYCLITFLAYFMSSVWHFYCLAVVVGLFQGGIQALSRSLYSQLIPPAKAAEFFGFYNMLGKFAAVLGPAMVGIIARVTGDARLGILSILVLFGAGGILLAFVDVDAGKRIARAQGLS